MKRIPRFKSLRAMYRAASRWTQGTFARNIQDLEVNSISRTATCWCLTGALTYCYPDINERFKARERLAKVIDEKYRKSVGIVEFNDGIGRTINEIREVVRLARI